MTTPTRGQQRDAAHRVALAETTRDAIENAWRAATETAEHEGTDATQEQWAVVDPLDAAWERAEARVVALRSEVRSLWPSADTFESDVSTAAFQILGSR